MATDISNSLGTFYQFLPRANMQVGRYERPNILPVYNYGDQTDSSTQLFNTMNKLSKSLLLYDKQEQDEKNSRGEFIATNMIKSATSEDIMKMNAIDLAQTYGYADSSDNPYMLAYAEKLRGSFIADRLKNEYDLEYQDSPARSADEELKRYREFTDERYKDLREGIDPKYQKAFTTGFYDNNLNNLGLLSSKWFSNKKQENVEITLSETQAQLGDIITRSGELLSQDNHSFTDEVQQALNNTRLMGLPVKYRVKLTDDFIHQLIESGHIPLNRLEQMMDKVTIAMSPDGDPIPISKVLNKQDFRTINLANNLRFDNVQKEQDIRQYGDTKQSKAYLNLANSYKDKNPEEYRRMMTMYPTIKQREEQKIREEQQARRLAYQQMLRRTAVTGSRTATSKISDPEQIGELLEGWRKGITVVHGKSFSSLQFDKDALEGVALDMATSLMDKSDFKGLDSLLRVPQLSNFSKDLATQFTYALDNAQIDESGNVQITPDIERLLNFAKYNPNMVSHVFGSDLGNKTTAILALTRYTRNQQKALNMYTQWAQSPQDIKEGWKSQVSNQIDESGYTLEGVENLNPSNDPTSIAVWSDPTLRANITQVGSILAMQRGSAYDGLNDAGQNMQDNYYYFRGALIPKDTVDEIQGTNEGDKQIARKALQDALDDETDYDEDVSITYDPTTRLFNFTSQNPHLVQGSYVYVWTKPRDYIIKSGEERLEKVGQKMYDDYALSLEKVDTGKPNFDVEYPLYPAYVIP